MPNGSKTAYVGMKFASASRDRPKEKRHDPSRVEGIDKAWDAPELERQ